MKNSSVFRSLQHGLATAFGRRNRRSEKTEDAWGAASPASAAMRPSVSSTLAAPADLPIGMQPAVAYAFRTLAPARRDAFTNVLRRLGHVRPDGEWPAMVEALADAARGLEPLRFKALGEVVCALAMCNAPAGDWKLLVAAWRPVLALDGARVRVFREALVRGVPVVSSGEPEARRSVSGADPVSDFGSVSASGSDPGSDFLSGSGSVTTSAANVLTLAEAARLCACALDAVPRDQWGDFADAARGCVLQGADAVERGQLMHAVVRVPADARAGYQSVAQTLCAGLGRGAKVGPVFEALSLVYACSDQALRVRVCASALGVCSRTMDAAARGIVIRALNVVPMSEQAAFRALCEPLRAVSPPSDFALNIQLVAHTPAPAREAHRDRLLDACKKRQRGGNYGDLENVSVGTRMLRAQESLHALAAHVGKVNRKQTLARLQAQLLAWHERDDSPASMWKRHAGAYVIDNALRTFDGERQFRDFAESLVENAAFALGAMDVNVGDVSAQVWAAIERYPEAAQRAMLRESFVHAMADCIEQDGYRVCNNGIVQRLVQVLQGYVPGIWLDYATPQARVCEVTQAFARGLGETAPSAAHVSAWLRGCIADAEDVYGRASPDLSLFIRHLQSYVEYVYP